MARMCTADYKQGQIMFTQGVKEARWLLLGGNLKDAGGMVVATLCYSPGGKAGGAVLTVVFGKRGDVPLLIGMSVRGGPAGDATYSARLGKCALHLGQIGPGTVEGSADCEGGFQGTAISKLTFSAKP